MRKAWVMAVAAACLFGPAAGARAPAPFPRHKKAEDGAARVVRAMESYRVEIPPAEGFAEQNGLTVVQLEPYLMSHLSGVARRLRVGTRAECLALLPYVADRDFKLRFIAVRAIDGATNAYPHGTSVEWFLDTGSEGHGRMVRRFRELIGMLEH